MTYSKYNIVYRLQKWMDSVAGQTFLNYAYSWGASVVILGTLFKLTNLPLSDVFLYVGMGTEVFVFFISAFDRPFDKTADGMILDPHYRNVPYMAAAMPLQGATETRIQEIIGLSKSLENAATLIDVLNQLNDCCTKYKQSSTEFINMLNDNKSTHEDIMNELETMRHNLQELNKIYGRMIDAVKTE